MAFTIDDLSPNARNLLNTALDGQGRAKGLLVTNEPLGGALIVAAGDSQWRLYGDDKTKELMGFHELLDHRLIVEFSIEGVPAGYMVTPLGCELAWAEQ